MRIDETRRESTLPVDAAVNRDAESGQESGIGLLTLVLSIFSLNTLAAAASSPPQRTESTARPSSRRVVPRPQLPRVPRPQVPRLAQVVPMRDGGDGLDWDRVSTHCTTLGCGLYMLVIILYVAWIMEQKVSTGYPLASFLLSAWLCSSLVACLTVLMICVNPRTHRHHYRENWPECTTCNTQVLDSLQGVFTECPSHVREDWRCAICLDDCIEKGQELRELVSCKHVFHRECIDRWILSKPLHSLKCPLCRGPVFKSHPIDYPSFVNVP